MKILKLWVVTSCTAADRNVQPSSSGQKIEKESFTKMYIASYQIMWCYTVNSNETHTKSTAKSKITPDNHTPPHPPNEKTKFTKFCANKGQESFTVHETKSSNPPILYFHVSHTNRASSISIWISLFLP
jgi:hypothetical protein